MSAIQDFKRFSDLTNAELDAYHFEIDDPRDIPNLTFDIPDGVNLVGIVHHYRFLNEKLRCADCYRAIHNRGAVILLSNGQHCLLGSTCGARRFPNEWHDAVSEYDRARKLRDFRERNGQLIETVPKLLIAASHLRAPYEALTEFKQAVREALGPLVLQHLQPALRDGESKLYREVQIDSRVREAFDTAQTIGGRKQASVQFRRELIGHVSGMQQLLNYNCKRELESGIAQLGKVQKSISSVNTPLPKQKRAHELYDQAIHRIRETLPIYEAAKNFASKESARVLRSWASEHDLEFAMQVKGTDLRIRCSGYGYQTISMSGLPGVDELRAKVGIAGARLMPRS